MPSVNTENAERITPNSKASLGLTLPRGIGREAVRAICASMSASYHMLSAPDAPAPTAMQSSAMTPRTGWSEPGATTMPTSAVNTTSDITRGLSSAMKSPTSPPISKVGGDVSIVSLKRTSDIHIDNPLGPQLSKVRRATACFALTAISGGRHP